MSHHMVTDYDIRHGFFEMSGLVHIIRQKCHLLNNFNISDERAKQVKKNILAKVCVWDLHQ